MKKIKHTISQDPINIKVRLLLLQVVVFLIILLTLKPDLFGQKFAVVGDYGWNPSNTQTALYPSDSTKAWIGAPYDNFAVRVVSDMVKSWNPEFVVSVGDDSYWCRLQNNFEDNVQPFYGSYVADNNFFPVLGNHDYKTTMPNIGSCLRDGKNGETLWKEYFSKSTTYYDYVKGDIHFFAMNFNADAPDLRDVNSVQGRWLKQGLQNSTAKFKIVYGHQPVYASCPPGDAHCSNTDLQWPFQEWGADVVISGDNHYYERNIVDGFTYVVNGLGGALIDVRGSSIPGTTVSHFPTNENDKKWGAMLVETKSDNGDYLLITMYDHTRTKRDEFIVRPNQAQWRNCD